MLVPLGKCFSISGLWRLSHIRSDLLMEAQLAEGKKIREMCRQFMSMSGKMLASVG